MPKGDLVTDGPRLYFQETINGHGVISQVSATGGEVVQIPTPFRNVAVLDAAPGRSEILARNDDLTQSLMSSSFSGPLWVVPVPAGSPRRLGDLSALDAGWTPDGQKLLFGHGSDLYLANAVCIS